MTRPVREYHVSFAHVSGVAFECDVLGETPCEAKNEAWCILEDAKRSDPQTYPGDNHWSMVFFQQGGGLNAG
jgi:hypothetical protein